MAESADEFLATGIEMWGRAQALLAMFEEKLKDRLAEVGEKATRGMGVTGVTSKSRILARGTNKPCILVEMHGRLGRDEAQVFAGIEWFGLVPRYYAGVCAPLKLRSLRGLLSEEEKKSGLDLEHDEGQDWIVLPAGKLEPEDGLMAIFRVLGRKAARSRAA